MSTSANVSVCICQIASNRISLLRKCALRASLFSEPEIIQPPEQGATIAEKSASETHRTQEHAKNTQQIAIANRTSALAEALASKAEAAEPTSRSHSKATGRVKREQGRKEQTNQQQGGGHINSEKCNDIRK